MLNRVKKTPNSYLKNIYIKEKTPLLDETLMTTKAWVAYFYSTQEQEKHANVMIMTCPQSHGGTARVNNTAALYPLLKGELRVHVFSLLLEEFKQDAQLI